MLCIKFPSLFWSLNQKHWRRNYKMQVSLPLWWLRVNPYGYSVFSKMGEKGPAFVTLFLPEYIIDRTVDLISPINGRGHDKTFQAEGNPARLPKKIIFHDSITRGVLFAEKVLLRYRCKPRHILGENCYTHSVESQLHPRRPDFLSQSSDHANFTIGNCYLASCTIADFYLANCTIAHHFPASCTTGSPYLASCSIKNSYLALCTIASYFIANCTIRNSCLANCTIEICYLAYCRILSCYLANCTIGYCYLINWTVGNYYLAYCTIRKSDLANFTIGNCYLAYCTIEYCYLENCMMQNFCVWVSVGTFKWKVFLFFKK